jgi:hypothetical protein
MELLSLLKKQLAEPLLFTRESAIAELSQERTRKRAGVSSQLTSNELLNLVVRQLNPPGLFKIRLSIEQLLVLRRQIFAT